MIPAVQIPDFAGTILRGQQGALQQQEMADNLGLRAELARLGPDGLQGDSNTLARLAGFGPRGVQLAQTIAQQADQRRSQLREQLPMIAGLLEGATPENYGEIRARALAAGIGPSVLPETFDPVRVEGVRNAAMAMRQARAAEAAETYNATLPQRMMIAQAGRTSVNLRLPPMENSFAQQTGRTLAEEAGGLVQAGQRAGDTLRMVQRFEQGLQNFDTGAAANARLTVGQFAQQLGIPDSALPRGINRDAVASAEDMRAMTGQMLAAMIGPGGFPAQNFSNADREMLERALPNIANTPEGNRLLLAAVRAGAQRNLQVAQAWREWQQQNGVSADSYLRFQRERLPQITERDIIAPIVAGAGRQPQAGGVPIPGAGGLSASPPPAPSRLRFDANGNLIR